MPRNTPLKVIDEKLFADFVDNLREAVEVNINRFGIQDIPTLTLTLAEGTGEVAQAYLSYSIHKELHSRVSGAACNVAALGYQIIQFLHCSTK